MDYRTRVLVWSCRSLWQADSAQQVCEARVATQQVESGIHPDEGHSIGTGEIGFLEPREGLLLIAQGSVYACHVEPADIPLPRLFLDLS